jgi:excisionase family DNA binding protein
MENIILHSTPLKDFRDIIGNVIEEKLKQFSPEAQQNQNIGYITRKEVCNMLRISLSTLNSYSKDGTLQGYRIGGKILFKSAEIEHAIHQIQANKYKHRRK